MTITLEIHNEDHAEELWAVGAKDLLEHFFPKGMIHPDKVVIVEYKDRVILRDKAEKPK